MATEKTKLSDIVEKNSSLLSVIGIFAAIGTYFQSQIDPSDAFFGTSKNYFYYSISFLSYCIIYLLYLEFKQKILLIKDKSLKLKIFSSLFSFFTYSIMLMVFVIFKKYIIVLTPLLMFFLVAIIIAYIEHIIDKILIKISRRYVGINKYVKRLGFFVLTIFFILIYVSYFSETMNNIIIKMLEMIPE